MGKGLEHNFTRLHAILSVPDGKTIPVQVFLALPMDFKMHLHLPVSEVTRLQEKERGCEIRVYQTWLAYILRASNNN